MGSSNQITDLIAIPEHTDPLKEKNQRFCHKAVYA